MSKSARSINTHDDYSENSLVELKVSSDHGETWERRMVNMSEGLEYSGLKSGDIFQFQGEKYEVLNGEDGLRVQPLKKNKSSKRR